MRAVARMQSRGRGWLAGAARATALLAAVGAAVPCGHAWAADDAPKQAVPDDVRKVRTWFAGLSAGDPTVREDSRRKLLTLTRKELPILRDVVRSRVPLMPAESQALRDIVTHVYLAGAPVSADDASRGFVGVYFDLEQDSVELSVPGVEIRHRMPGCCAYRYLEDGDVVLSIGRAGSFQEVRVPREMTAAVILYGAGDTVTFEILRRGRLIHLPVTLGARPRELASSESIPDFLSQRLADANGYWDANFEPVVSGASTQAMAK